MRVKQEVLNNIYILSIVKKVNTILFGLVVTILIHRLLTPSEKGQYEYINNIVVLLTAILNLGVSLVLPNYERSRNKWTLSTFYILSLLQFLLLCICSVVIACVFSNVTLIIYGLAVAFGVFSLQMLNCTMVYKFKVTAIANIVGVIGNAFILFIFLLGNVKSINTIFVAVIFKEALCSFICFFSMIKSIHIKKVHYKEWCNIIRFGLIPMIVSVLVILNYKLDILELRFLHITDYNIGIYSVGLSMAEYFLLFSDAFKDVLFNKTAIKDDYENVNFSLRVCSTIMILAFIVFIILGKLVIGLIYGNDYLNSYKVTIIVIVGTFSMMYFKLLGTLFVAQGKWLFYFFVLLGSVIINLFTNLILIPVFGIYGAAVTSLLSYSFAGLLFLFKYMRDNHFHISDVVGIKKEDMNRIVCLVKKKSGGSYESQN